MSKRISSRLIVVALSCVVDIGLFAQKANLAIAAGDTAAPLKVGFILVGPVNDFGWNYAHDQGRRYLEKALKGKVITSLAENVPENAEVERVMEKMIAQGTKLIFATSYGYLEPSFRVAARHPDVIIMHCGNRSRPQPVKNVSTYWASQYQAAYVVGMVAGRATKKNSIGCIGGHAVPQILLKLNSFALGVHAVNPKAKVHVVWSNSWCDPSVEAEAAESLIDSGVDVLASGDIDSPLTVARTAEKHHINTVSYNCSDLHSIAPKGWLVSAYFDWGPLYAKVCNSVVNHNWVASDARYGLKDGYVKLTDFGPTVPLAVQKEASDLVKQLADGRVIVFKGPIKDRQGKMRIAPGRSATESELEKIDWVVPWVEGSYSG